MPQGSIVVVGAGVIGLSTAILLQQRLPQHTILIIASELPTSLHPTADYASAWAGAHYRPIPASTQQLRDEAELAIQTSVTMRKIAKESPEAGLAEMKGVEYLEAPTEVELKMKMGEVYAWPGDNFRVLGANELPDRVKWGCEYDTYCVNVPVYCRWLLQRFQDREDAYYSIDWTKPRKRLMLLRVWGVSER